MIWPASWQSVRRLLSVIVILWGLCFCKRLTAWRNVAIRRIQFAGRMVLCGRMRPACGNIARVLAVAGLSTCKTSGQPNSRSSCNDFECSKISLHFSLCFAPIKNLPHGRRCLIACHCRLATTNARRLQPAAEHCSNLASGSHNQIWKHYVLRPAVHLLR